ncbi:MAG TPA: GGDEF domain-containing phosphodiesterase [Candidatus Binatia bacterium]|nr:GGDEF domain-containing phosphodiesterase [Candidatus Binatia bacterium]
MTAPPITATTRAPAQREPQRLLLLGFPPAEAERVRELCRADEARYAVFSRLSADVEDVDHGRYDCAALFLAGSGLDDLAYLMRLSSRCATVVVSGQSEAEVRWLRLINCVVPVTEFTPARLLAAADEAQLRRRHQFAGSVAADALQSLRRAVGSTELVEDPGILILDERDRVVFANPSAKALGSDTTRRLLDTLRQRGWPQRSPGEQRIAAPTPGAEPLSVSVLALEEHGQPLNVLRIERAASGPPTESLLQHLSLIDAQTGLPNRSHFLAQLEQAANSSAGTPARIALLLMQLERPGESAGREDTLAAVRRIAAERLAECVRTDDLVARLGGDVFAVLLRGFSRTEDLLQPARKLLAAVSAPYLVEGKPTRIGAHMGVAVFPEDGRAGMELLHRADRALTRARSGGAAVEFFQADLGKQLQRRWLLESRLPAALAERRFTAHYQPLVEPHSGRITGVEALARWHDPELGMVPPVEFIPLIEELRLMNELSAQVWEQAFLQLREWRAGLSPDLTLSINVSPSQFLWPGFLNSLHEQLQRTGVPPAAVEIEITEGLLLEDRDLTRLVLNEAAQLGVRVYLDDFGTGYSSLGYLVDLPVAGIKVDRTFCSGLPTSQNHVAMTVTILTLARHLKLDVLVEGVETLAQARFLTRHHVPRLQGFLYSKPLPPEQMGVLLADGSLLPTG